jgi:hypothetical protein
MGRGCRFLILTALVGAVLLTAAAAAQAPDVRIDLQPNRAGRASTLLVAVEGGPGQADGRTPSSVVLSIQRGFVIDPRARARRCTDRQAENFRCPERSRIGSGTAVVTASGAIVPGGSQDFTASLDVFLARPPRANDLAGVVVSFHEPTTGRRGTTTGRIVRRGRGAFGYELRFAGLDGGEAPPPGVSVELKRLDLRAGARRRQGGTTFNLIRNPDFCDGTWTGRGEVRFTDGSSAVRRIEVHCRP